MPELRGFFAGSPRYVRSQILHGGAFETSQAKSSCHESFIKSIQVLAGRKDNPFAVPKLKASVSMGAAEAFCYSFACGSSIHIRNLVQKGMATDGERQ